MIARLALTVVLGAAVLSTPPSAASSTAETCQGQPATIVGQPGAEVAGTDGPDVVVTNGAGLVLAGGGDDLVCVTAGAGLDDAQVMGGDGADVIDATATQALSTFSDLGDGDDTYLGGPAPDSVWASDPWDRPRGQGDDTILTGGGDDSVATGGQPGIPDHDSIDLGSGSDHVAIQGPTEAGATVGGGDGIDQMDVDRIALRRPLVLDNGLGRATDAGVEVLAWSGFERFRLSHIGPFVPPSFIGGAGPERIWTGIPLTSARLGGGDDVLNLAHQDNPVRATYDGGDGHDYFILLANDSGQARRVDLDLPRRTMLFEPERGDRVRSRITGFERYKLSSDRLDVRGTPAAERIDWLGCRGVVHGGPGADLIERFWNADRGCGFLDQESEQVVRGGRGSDRLVGTFAPDILIGGPGDDVADGRGGRRDRCVAEIERHCER